MIDRQTIEDKIKEIIGQYCIEPSDVYNINVTTKLLVADCKTPFDDLDMLEMLMAFEEEYDIEIVEDRHQCLLEETNWSIQNIVDYVAIELGVE